MSAFVPCAALTQKGKPCKNNVRVADQRGIAYCAKHRPTNVEEPKPVQPTVPVVVPPTRAPQYEPIEREITDDEEEEEEEEEKKFKERDEDEEVDVEICDVCSSAAAVMRCAELEQRWCEQCVGDLFERLSLRSRRWERLSLR